MTEASPQGDPVLADFFAKCSVEPDPEKIVATDWLATALNRERLGIKRRIVDLACGHKAVTSNSKRMRCPRCIELLRHGFDYDRFRRLGDYSADGLLWPDDPCRDLNEPGHDY